MAVTALPTPEPEDDGDEILEFDVNSLTLGEVEEMEEILGREVMKELGQGDPSVKTLVVLVYVMKRRDNPEYTMADARQVKVAMIKGESKADPKDGAADS